MKALIIDDSKPNRDVLQAMLEEFFPEFTEVNSATDAMDGYTKIKSLKPDVLFLDIEMPEISGLQLLEKLNKENINIQTVFVTAYNEYAIQAFKLSAIDYILKPVKLNDLKDAIEKVKDAYETKFLKERYQTLLRNTNNNDNTSQIVLAVDGKWLFINLTDILYLKADGAYTHIYLENGDKIMASKKISDFEDILGAEKKFFRSHRSYILNLNKIKEFIKSDRGRIIMRNNQEVDLARDRRNEFFKLIEENKI